jgi:hypothetical protein
MMMQLPKGPILAALSVVFGVLAATALAKALECQGKQPDPPLEPSDEGHPNAQQPGVHSSAGGFQNEAAVRSRNLLTTWDVIELVLTVLATLLTFLGALGWI